jgi:REP element-mobilizing transposase RayT
VERYRHSPPHLFTFRSYGTWLHGDERGSIDRYNNRYQSPFALASTNREEHNHRQLKSEPVILTAIQRVSVETAIRETCAHRNWHLRAISVRTNHVHLVASIGDKTPGLALNAFKANATRQMRLDGCWGHEHSPWVDNGSKRNLWNERSVERAIEYVINGQGDKLPEFD